MMATREHIADCIREFYPHALCDECIGHQLAMSRGTVARHAHGLAESGKFTRQEWACSLCREWRLVTSAAPALWT